MNTVYEVSQINAYLKDKLDTDPLLANIYVRGELSNYKVYPSGHHYFTLKDAEGSLKCVMFKSSAMRLRFRPENGMRVIVMGRITVYPRDGAYQLYCAAMTPDGVGDLHVAFEQLKQKLYQEGLFDPQHKKMLPPYPHKIAIITSSAGAAVHDMLTILARRYPLAQVMLVPVRVQGEEAKAEIVEAIAYVNQHSLADVIITGRGGGSLEDLWAFNEESVARAIYVSRIPVISAVGHEPDVTISDFVADVRAATPSNGAEIVSPDKAELLPYLAQLQSRLVAAMSKKVQVSRQQLSYLENHRILLDPVNYLADRRLNLDYLQQRFTALMQSFVQRKKGEFTSLASALDAMSPLKVLSRGYSMARQENGALVKSVQDITPGKTLVITVTDGSIYTTVREIEEEFYGK